MLRFLTDQNFDQDITRGLVARAPNLDIISAFNAKVSGYEDPDLLRWTAEHNRILITHDSPIMAFATLFRPHTQSVLSKSSPASDSATTDHESLVRRRLRMR